MDGKKKSSKRLQYQIRAALIKSDTRLDKAITFYHLIDSTIARNLHHFLWRRRHTVTDIE